MMFKVGDRVWSYSKQKCGTVTSIDKHEEDYPVAVVFDDAGFETYTFEGNVLLEYKAPDLFKKEMVMVEKK